MKQKSKYDDITNEFISFKKKSGKVINMKVYENIDGKKYYVDGKNVVLDYSLQELEFAKWLAYTFYENVYMIPRVNSPERISTPDFIFKMSIGI